MSLHNISITIKSGAEVEAITVDETAVSMLFPDMTEEQLVALIKTWLFAAFGNRIQSTIASSLVQAWVREHIPTSS